MNYKDSNPKLELKLNLSPPRRQAESPHESVSSAEVSPRSSCVSRETSPDDSGLLRYSSSPESSSSMMLVGCPRCLMYVMLLEDDPKCPKCKSTVLLDFMHEDRARQLKKWKILPLLDICFSFSVFFFVHFFVLILFYFWFHFLVCLLNSTLFFLGVTFCSGVECSELQLRQSFRL